MESDGARVGVDRIVLHIGTEKTGTSSIQHFLAKNRVALAGDGIVYPRFTGAEGGSQWGFVAAVVERPWRMDIGPRLGICDQASADAYRMQLVESIDQELLGCPERHTLLLSCEHFHSRLREPARVWDLKKLLARWSDNVQIIVYLRRQDRVAVSHYSTRLKSGHAAPRVFPEVDGGRLPYYYDYECIYDTWSGVFGEQAVQVGLYGAQRLASGDLLSDFCGRVGIREGGKKRPARVNRSLSEQGVRLLIELNRQWPKESLSVPDRSRDLLVDRISRKHPGRSWPATRAEAEAFYAHFVDSNANLAKRAFSKHQADLFDVDFSDYPETLASRRADLSEEVSRLISVYRSASDRKPKAGARLLLTAGKMLGGVSLRFKSLVARDSPVASRATGSPAVDLPPVFLHMGLPKTATKTLQDTLFPGHPGICYLGRRRGWKTKKKCANDELYNALRPIFWQPKDRTDPEFVRSVVRAYSRENGPEKPILGSWEGLAIKPLAEFEEMLRDAQVALGDVRVLITLRNPLQRLPSAYLHALKECVRLGEHHTIPAGKVYLPFDEWLTGVHREPTAHDYRFGFGDNLRFAVELLGRDKVGVFLFEEMIEDRLSFFSSVLDFMGLDSGGVELIADKYLNSALTTNELDFLKSIEGSDDERERWLKLDSTQRRARLAACAATGIGEKCVISLTDTQRQLIEVRSRDLNRWLVATFGLDLARHQYPL